MADKRTPPDPAEGARRRKRPAPTIDLDGNRGAGGHAAEQPQAAAEPPRAAGATARTMRPMLPTITSRTCTTRFSAGRAGGLANFHRGICAAPPSMTAALLGLRFAGLVPSRDAGSAPARSGIGRRAQPAPGKIEVVDRKASRQRSGHVGTAVGRRQRAQVARHRAHRDQQAQRRGRRQCGRGARTRGRIGKGADRIAQQRAGSQQESSAGLSPADVEACKNASPSLEQVVQKRADRPRRGLALSAAALRDAVVRGAPFSAELGEVKIAGRRRQGAGAAGAVCRDRRAASAALAHELRALMPALLKAAGAQAPAGGFLDRLQANAGKLVRVRPVDAPAGDDAAAVLARLEVETAHADIDGALADLERARCPPCARRRKPGSPRRSRGRPRLPPRANSPPTRRARSASDEAGMIRVVLFLVSVALIAVGFAWVADRPGEVAITWMGYRDRNLGDGGGASPSSRW